MKVPRTKILVIPSASRIIRKIFRPKLCTFLILQTNHYSFTVPFFESFLRLFSLKIVIIIVIINVIVVDVSVDVAIGFTATMITIAIVAAAGVTVVVSVDFIIIIVTNFVILQYYCY